MEDFTCGPLQRSVNFPDSYIETVLPGSSFISSSLYGWPLKRFLALIYPVIPQITSVIAEEKGIDLLNSEWPKTEKVKGDLALISKVMTFNSEVWKKKKEAGVSLREEIKGVEIPEDLKVFEKDLKACHKI